MGAAGGEAAREGQGPPRRRTRPGDEKRRDGQECGSDRLHEHGRNDDGPAAAGVDEPSAEDAHADRGQRVRRVEEGERLRSEEHTSELQSLAYLVCRLLLEKKKTIAV